MKKIYLFIFILFAALSWAAYDIPVGDIFLDAGSPATPDTTWYIFNVDGTDIDSVACYPTYYRYDTVFSRTDAGSTMVVYLRARFSSGRQGYNSYLFSINEEWAHQSTVDSLIDSLNSLSLELAKSLDSLALIIDSIQNLDNWAAHQSTSDSIFDSLMVVYDSVFAVLDSVQLYLDAAISSRSSHSAADVYTEFTSGSNEDAFKATGFSTFDPATDVVTPTDTSEGGGNIGSVGQDTTAIKALLNNNPATFVMVPTDTAEGGGSIGSTGQDTTAIKAMITNNPTLVKTDVSSLALEADVLKALDSLAKIIDSTENFNNWIASATELSKALDSLGKIIDSLEALSGYSTDIMDTLYQYVDSIDALVSSAGGTAAISDADMSAIMDSLFARMVADTVAGTYLSTLLSSAGSASGGGAFTVNVYVFDSSASNAPVTDAPVFANNTAQSMINPYFDLTDNNGLATFQLDAADWVLLTNKAGYNSLIDTQTVSASVTCTLMVYSSSANKTTVYGMLRKPDGSAYDYAIVQWKLIAYPVDSILTYNDSAIIQTYIYDTADVNGYWNVNVYANDSLSDSSYYQVVFKDRYGVKIRRESDMFVNVPDTTLINFKDIEKKRNETGSW